MLAARCCILALVLLVGSALAAFGAERKYTTVVEPNEKAFSFLVQDGWTTKGSLVRPSLVAFNFDMTGSSADGKVTTLATDVFPAYIEPVWGGYPVGTRYSLGFGAIGEVKPYTPAADFIKKGVLPKRLGKFKVTRVVDRKDLLKGAPVLPGTTAAHAAEVEYTFERDGKPYLGGMLCITGAMTDGTFTYWHVDRLVGYEAPKDRVEEGKAALTLADVTLRWNPIWVKAQAKGAADRRKIIEGLLEYKSEAISTAYWNHSRAMDSIFKRIDDGVKGTIDLYDASTGRILYNQENKSNYYFIDYRGHVVGNDTGTSPGVDFRPLTPLPYAGR